MPPPKPTIDPTKPAVIEIKKISKASNVIFFFSLYLLTILIIIDILTFINKNNRFQAIYFIWLRIFHTMWVQVLNTQKGMIQMGYVNVYETIGKEKLYELIDTFYKYVSTHETLSPIFPGDWKETARKQKLFMTQLLGGPALYSMERGHPMMRARHLPFPITVERATEWIECMEKAMDEAQLQDEIKAHLLMLFKNIARNMINTKEELR